MKKRFFAGLLAGTLLFSTASAASMEFTVGNTALKIEKEAQIEEKVLDAAPYISEAGRTMVPVRAISEAFGAEVSWDGDTRTVIVKKDGMELSLTIDKDEATVNGEVKKLDAPPVIVSDRTFVPLRFVGEALSCNVQYASVTKQILIDDTEAVLVCGNSTISFAEFKAMYEIFYLGSREYALSSGMDEIEFGQLAAQMALSTAEQILWIKEAFPQASLLPSEQEGLLAALETNAATLPEMKGYAALVYEKNQIASGMPVVRYIQSTENLEAIYNANYVMAKHVLVEDEATANTVYAKATGGADFDALVQEYNIDPGMLEKPEGYIFTKGEMVEPFEVATFAAKEGEITKPVKTDYGYHIIKRMPLAPYGIDKAEMIATGIANRTLQSVAMPQQTMEVETLYEKLGVSSK